jgi:hypothetical protein|tara:strand:- start:319 stop:549 length:231 start_codon:yes stop_codon:yes gene_type:complete
MTRQEKADELRSKFGESSINQVKDTLDIWEYKKLIRSQEMIAYQCNKHKYETAKNGHIISKRTLKYWNGVLEILKK